MATYRYVIVGSGMAAHAAAGGIREVDPEGSVAMFGEEPHPPYQRPPLSKKLWSGMKEEDVWLPPAAGVVLHAGRRIVALDPGARRVTDDAGEPHRYERLLLATGGSPRRLPLDEGRVIYFRTLEDYRRLRAAPGRRAVVVGGGCIGSEIAAALASTGRSVTMVFPEEAIGARGYPRDLAAAITDLFREKGVAIRAGETVTAIRPAGDGTRVRTSAGAVVDADAVVAGLGIRPNVDLAAGAGIAVSDGIEVDESLRTSAPVVWAAGDVARFPCAALGARVRVEHEDAALTMGRAAGRAMAGAEVAYRHLPFFYSDLFELGYEAVGRLDARLETVADWKVPFREGIVYYLDRGRVRGVLLVNTWGQVDAARALIAREDATRPEDVIHALAH